MSVRVLFVGLLGLAFVLSSAFISSAFITTSAQAAVDAASSAASAARADPSLAASPGVVASPCNNTLGQYAPPPNALKRPAPSLSGVTDLATVPSLASLAGTPFTAGVVRVRIACGQAIDGLMKKYGLTGSYENWSPPPFDAQDRRAGIDRSYRIHVSAGSEKQIVSRLAASRADFDWVQLDWQFPGSLTLAVSDPCLATPSSSPCSGSASLGGQPNLLRAKLPRAWDKTVSFDAVVIAVIDSGLRETHEDTGVWKQKTGWDYVRGIQTPAGTAIDDSRCNGGHGTQVATIAAADTNNGKGVAGAGFNSGILPMRVWQYNSNTAACDIWASSTRDWPIRWARMNGALVVNMSYYFLGPDPDEQSVMPETWNAGTTPVASSGNFDRNIDSQPLYPCAYLYVVCVGANDNAGIRCASTGYGTSVDFTAASTYAWGAGASSDTNYIFDSCHTSYSTPLVSGVLALLRSIGKGPQAQYDALSATVQGNPGGLYAHGEVDAGAALWF